MTSVKNRARHLLRMSMRPVRKNVDEYDDYELASLLEMAESEVGESVEELTEVLRDVDEEPTDEQVAELWEIVDTLDDAARSLCKQTVEASSDDEP